MFHLHDVSRRRRVGSAAELPRPPVRSLVRPRTTTAAYHKSFMTSKCHSRNSLPAVTSLLYPPSPRARSSTTTLRSGMCASRLHYLRKCIAINSFDAMRIIGFICAVLPQQSINHHPSLPLSLSVISTSLGSAAEHRPEM